MFHFKTIGIALAIVFLGIFTSFAHEWMAPAEEAAVRNPLDKTEQIIQSGQKIFQDFCMNCHGQDARGLANSETGLERRPPDLQKTIRSHSDGDFFWKIRTGRNEMPSFKEDLAEEEIWSTIHYIRSMTAPEKGIE